jgi:hypothetical protein
MAYVEIFPSWFSRIAGRIIRFERWFSSSTGIPFTEEAEIRRVREVGAWRRLIPGSSRLPRVTGYERYCLIGQRSGLMLLILFGQGGYRVENNLGPGG